MPPPSMLPRLGGLVVFVTAAAKPPNLFSYSILGVGLGSPPSFPSSSTRRRSSSARSRRWWSDEAQFDGDDDDEFEDDDEEGPSAFGGSAATWGQAFDEPWFTKALRAYGYVLPVILVSMLLATGPQAFLMAMAIPLAQSALSFAVRAFSNTPFWGRPDDQDDDYYYPDYTSSGGWEESEEYSNTSSTSTKYADSSSRSQQRPWAKHDGRSEDSEPTAGSDGTASASSSDDASKTASDSGAGFGGWDELDAGSGQYRSSRPSAGASAAPGTAATATGGASRSVRRKTRRPQPETATRGRRSRAAARYRQSPLLVRLLVALFPFLGSWFRIML